MRPTSFAASLIALSLCAGMTHAHCPSGSEILVSCTVEGGAKRLDTCLMGNEALYRFGRSGAAPDLELRRHVRDVGFTPWPGIGRTIWESFTFSNGGVDYEVHYSIDRMIEENAGQDIGGGVTVLKGDKVLASLTCDPGSVETAGYGLPLFEAKEAAGECYSPEARSWNAC